jgi:peroxiredoxin family protein
MTDDSSSMALVVRIDAYDQIITPLAYAYLGSAIYDEVDVLFINWAVKLLSEDGLTERLSPATQARDVPIEALKEQVRDTGLPAELDEIVAELDDAGVGLYACSMAADVFDVTDDDLVPEADSIEGATWFMTEKAESADVFLQF